MSNQSNKNVLCLPAVPTYDGLFGDLREYVAAFESKDCQWPENYTTTDISNMFMDGSVKSDDE